MIDERRKQVADAKAKYLSGDELMAAVAGETVDHEVVVGGKVAGVIQIRSLEFGESQRQMARMKDDRSQLIQYTLEAGMVEPKLTDAQRAAIQRGKPGPLMEVAQHVMLISGMMDEEGGSPLDGGGSSNEPTSQPS